MDWNLVFTVLGVGLAISVAVAAIGSVITAIQLAKFNAIRKMFIKDADHVDWDAIQEEIRTMSQEGF